MNASARGFGIVLFALSLLVAVSCGVEDPPIDRDVAVQFCSAAIAKLAAIDGELIDVYASSLSQEEKSRQALVLKERKKPWSKDFETYECEELAKSSAPLTTEPATTDWLGADVATTDWMTTDAIEAATTHDLGADAAETREKPKSWIAWLRGQGVVSAPRAETSPPQETADTAVSAERSGAAPSLGPCFPLPVKFSVINAQPEREVPYLLPGAVWEISTDLTAIDRVGHRVGKALFHDHGGVRITWRSEDGYWQGVDFANWFARALNPHPNECQIMGGETSADTPYDRAPERKQEGMGIYKGADADVTFQRID